MRQLSPMDNLRSLQWVRRRHSAAAMARYEREVRAIARRDRNTRVGLKRKKPPPALSGGGGRMHRRWGTMR